MAKKKFTNNFEDIFSSESSGNSSNNKKATRKIKSTYLFDDSILESIKAISYYERTPIGDIINQACKNYIESYDSMEKANQLYTKKQSGM